VRGNNAPALSLPISDCHKTLTCADPCEGAALLQSVGKLAYGSIESASAQLFQGTAQ
jgi:hypothetical protein